MRELYRSGTNPQQKLVAVNNKFGNKDIKFQQGTSRTIYDTLPWTVDGQSFRFFEDSASRNFPFANTGSDGNKLGVGETLVVSDIIFTILTYDPINNRYTDVNPLANTPGGKFSLLNFEIGNNRVIKDFAILAGESIYAKTVGSAAAVIDLDTDIVIPPLLQYILSLRLAVDGNTPEDNVYIRCTIHGAAGILAPRTTF